MKVILIVFRLSSILILANFYMSDIFSSFKILVQTQLGHYPYHPTLSNKLRVLLHNYKRKILLLPRSQIRGLLI